MQSCPSAAAATPFNLFHSSAAYVKGRGRSFLFFRGDKFWNVHPQSRAGLSTFGVPNLGFLTKPVRLLVPSSSSESQAEVAELELVDEDVAQLELPDHDDSRLVHVRLQIQRECRFGEQFFVAGDHAALGLWNPLDAAPMVWSDGHVWTAEMDLPVGMLIQFKFLLREINGKILWQSGPNRVLQTWETSSTISVFGHWESAAVQHVVQVQDVENQYEVEQDGLMIDEMQGQKALLETSGSSVSLDDQPMNTVSENIGHMPLKESGYPSKNFHVGRTLKISSNQVVAETRLWKGGSLASVHGPAPCLTTPNEGLTANDHEPELDQKQEEEEEVVKGYETKKEGINKLTFDEKLVLSSYFEGQGHTDNDPFLNYIKWGRETVSRIINFLGFV